MKRFKLGNGFSFEAYMKNVREKVSKCTLKTTGVLLDADGHVLTQVQQFQIVLRATQTPDDSIIFFYFFRKNVFSNARSVIHLVDVTSLPPDNLSGLKKVTFRHVVRVKTHSIVIVESQSYFVRLNFLRCRQHKDVLCRKGIMRLWQLLHQTNYFCIPHLLRLKRT